ncbi:glycosyl transferase family 2 [Mangrovimonas yunxiaonensis]|uniref:Glycosyl transferase family 2 n=1 Tax=Mangrovimonas yunxiaonensis TaxID=1197477 RepID=A0A084TKK1_9FLAO|nr:glycosyltransferase [Mangrovimonas yunxiaonensis]KFB01237.1 glycosyl transferase family 2 [Mangrovimonas yunxiaonensis]GGH37871.1 glycosyl transferase [Mangrovimonas yunxiaonensis]
MNQKKIITLIPHYNDPEGLKRSIMSIDDDIEVDVLVIDDGSTIKPNINSIKQVYENGEIYLKELESNKGLSLALNEGIKFAQEKGYPFIGRLDCGDYCKKNRFSKQLEYLINNPDVKLLGTWASYIDENNKKLYDLKHPIEYEKIKKRMFLNSMFVHPSVVINTEIFSSIAMYNPKYTRAAQDYDLFFRIVKKYKTTNYPEVLIDYVIDSNSISTKRRKLQVKHRILIILDNFYFGFYPIYGLLRSIVLLFLSRNTSNNLKKLLKLNEH